MMDASCKHLLYFIMKKEGIALYFKECPIFQFNKRERQLYHGYIHRRRTFLTLLDVKTDPVTLIERLETFSIDT